MPTLPLIGSDKTTIVDTEDYDWAKNYQWTLAPNGHVVCAESPDFYLCNGVAARAMFGTWTKHYWFAPPR